MSSTEGIEQSFRDYFRHWSFVLPPEHVARRAGGHIVEQGWPVGYVWGVEGEDEYLEVLAQHRMTNDRHFRIFASGRTEDLPTPEEGYVVADDAMEEEIEAARDAWASRNRAIYAQLRERGLLPERGGNLPAHEINEHLRSGWDA